MMRPPPMVQLLLWALCSSCLRQPLWLFLARTIEGCDAFTTSPDILVDSFRSSRKAEVNVPKTHWKTTDKRISGFRFRFAPPQAGVGIRRNSAASAVVDTMEHEPHIGNNLKTVKSLTTSAIFGCGTEEGLAALRLLNELCDHRLPFDFDSFRHLHQTEEALISNGFDNDADVPPLESSIIDKGERVISLLPKFLPEKSTNDFLESVRVLEEQGWMSTNPDSVDGLPSLHVNLVSQGEPLFASPEDDDDGEGSFGGQIHKLYELVRPFVYEILLPEADRLLRNNNNNISTRRLRVSDVFLRRYGQDICGGVTRKGISIHYDVYSRITAVVALDEVASKGDNGLFTLEVDEEKGETSNHKALRRFFPLTTGDCVLHTWDVLHGVDVEAGLDRTSLIVWFDEEEDNNDKIKTDEKSSLNKDFNENDGPLVSPWLSLEHQRFQSGRKTLDDGNDVRQFVLASALSSASLETQDEETESTRLYLTSASRGNTFAQTRMGSICEEGSLSSFADLRKEAFEVLEALRPFEELPDILKDMLEGQHESEDEQESGAAERTELACRFWLEASLMGNPLAQQSLADEVMFEASRSGNPQQRLLAATLFALADQQETEEEGCPSDSLARVIEYDVAARDVGSREEFLASPVVQTAHAALGAS